MTDIRTWLEGLDLGQYAEAFDANAIDLDFVRDLTGERAEHPEFEPSDFEALAAWARRLSVGEVMTKDPASIGPDGTAFEAADLLLRHRIKALPVVEDGRVAGIVYRSSLYHRLSEGILQSAPSPQPR